MRALSIFFAVILLAACGDTDAAQQATMPDSAPSITTADPDTAWIPLFDGTSLDYWRGYQQEEMPAEWIIEDGAMVLSDPHAGLDIISKDTFTDFDLEFEWKVGEGGNSGVIFRVSEDFDYPWMTGPEYQVLDDDSHSDGEPNKNSAGSNYDVHAPSVKANLPAGEWNQGRLLVQGDHVEHWLNGQKVVEYEFGSPEWQELVDGSKWAEMESYASLGSGHIAIQGDHTAVSYRNVRIRRL